VRDAFTDLPGAVELGQEPLLRNHVAKRHSPEMRESYRTTLPGKRNSQSKRDRLLWDSPGKTVRAQGKPKADGSGQKNSSHQAIHPDEPRQLTPRECARLQTFPDWYPFPATLVNAYRIIGDAVPCVLATVLGKAISEQIEADYAGVAGKEPAQRTEVSLQQLSLLPCLP
jgi:DNA (cytosine-5)-methyltransferase 1